VKGQVDKAHAAVWETINVHGDWGVDYFETTQRARVPGGWL
jgi:hypothetical protein